MANKTRNSAHEGLLSLRISLICLFFSSFLLLSLLKACQLGNEWEISGDLVYRMKFSYFGSVFLYIISTLILLKEVKHMISKSPYKLIYILWNIGMLLLLLLILLNGGPLDVYRVDDVNFRKTLLKNLWCLYLFLFLLLGTIFSGLHKK